MSLFGLAFLLYFFDKILSNNFIYNIIQNLKLFFKCLAGSVSLVGALRSSFRFHHMSRYLYKSQKMDECFGLLKEIKF